MKEDSKKHLPAGTDKLWEMIAYHADALECDTKNVLYYIRASNAARPDLKRRGETLAFHLGIVELALEDAAALCDNGPLWFTGHAPDICGEIRSYLGQFEFALRRVNDIPLWELRKGRLANVPATFTDKVYAHAKALGSLLGKLARKLQPDYDENEGCTPIKKEPLDMKIERFCDGIVNGTCGMERFLGDSLKAVRLDELEGTFYGSDLTGLCLAVKCAILNWNSSALCHNASRRNILRAFDRYATRYIKSVRKLAEMRQQVFAMPPETYGIHTLARHLAGLRSAMEEIIETSPLNLMKNLPSGMWNEVRRHVMTPMDFDDMIVTARE